MNDHQNHQLTSPEVLGSVTAAIAVKEGFSVNENGGFYRLGEAFSKEKYLSVINVYENLLQGFYPCQPTVSDLAVAASVSRPTAQKAISFFEQRSIETKQQGHGRRGVGSLIGFTQEHHEFLYCLYRSNPAQPLELYTIQFYQRYGFVLSRSTIQRWFLVIGPFKGKHRKTSKFPHARDSVQNIQKMELYLDAMAFLYHRSVVFADEKPMKEIEIFGSTRRDPLTGEVYEVNCNANSKNRYNILCSIQTRPDSAPVQYIITEEHGTSDIFFDFVMELLRTGFLRIGDIFVVDNCTIHFNGECELLAEYLWNIWGIRMVSIPAYVPELNPTELIFHALVERLKSLSSRFTSQTNEHFIFKIDEILSSFQNDDVLRFYSHCGYTNL